MDKGNLIKIDVLLREYRLDMSFIQALEENGLLSVIVEDDEKCVERECLGEMERMIRLHYDLDINMPGIEAIHHMLKKMGDMQDELNRLRARIGSREDDF